MASGKGIDKTSLNWKCSQDNINNIVNNGKNFGGQCQIKRDGYLNDSEMTVTYKCNDPPRRNIEEFVKENGKKGRGDKGDRKL